MSKITSLKDEVYSRVMEDIFSSTFKPNQIINEKELIERYGYSKTPIREALISLCDDQVLRNIPRYGYEVVKLTDNDIQEIMEYRWILESGFIPAICQNITDEQIQKLEDLNHLCNTTEEDLINHWHYNLLFHIQLMECSGNVYATQSLERTMNTLWRAYAQFYWDKNKKNSVLSDMKMHALVIEGLKNRNVDEVSEGLKKDFSDFLFF